MPKPPKRFCCRNVFSSKVVFALNFLSRHTRRNATEYDPDPNSRAPYDAVSMRYRRVNSDPIVGGPLFAAVYFARIGMSARVGMMLGVGGVIKWFVLV